MRCCYVDTPRGQIHYREKAGEGIPIVCLHQTASSSLMYERFADLFPGPNPIIAIDTPGFGMSFEPADEPNMASYAEMVGAAIDALGLHEIHLLGHHTGASIGVEMAVSRPAKVKSLAMIGPVVLSAEERDQFRGIYPKDFIPKEDGSHLMQMWQYVRELGADDVRLAHREFVDTARAWAGHIRVYRQIWDQDFGALFAKVACPMLIMCSEKDVLWTLFARAKEMRPDAMAVQLPGSNFQPDEAPAELGHEMKRFLSTL